MIAALSSDADTRRYLELQMKVIQRFAKISQSRRNRKILEIIIKLSTRLLLTLNVLSESCLCLCCWNTQTAGIFSTAATVFMLGGQVKRKHDQEGYRPTGGEEPGRDEEV